MAFEITYKNIKQSISIIPVTNDVSSTIIGTPMFGNKTTDILYATKAIDAPGGSFILFNTAVGDDLYQALVFNDYIVDSATYVEYGGKKRLVVPQGSAVPAPS